jgi:hypothetical protein
VRERIFSRRVVTAGRLRPHRIREIIRIASVEIREIIRFTSFKTERDVDEAEAFVRFVHPPSFTALGENLVERIAAMVHVRKCGLTFFARTIGVAMGTFSSTRPPDAGHLERTGWR